MKRIALLFVLPLFAAACRNSAPGGPTPDEDAGIALPDASILPPQDSGLPPVIIPPPTLAVVLPASGGEGGGTRVMLRGTSFVEPAQVTFGGTPALSVVVLDEVSIAATTPPGALGLVDVKVTTASGEADLPAAFRYVRELEITSVEPVRIPEEGGVPITVRGKGFDAKTLILFDRKPLIGATVEDDQTIHGYAPALSPGRPEIRGLSADAQARRSDLLVVYGTPEITALAPGFGPTDGHAAQDVLGNGFDAAEKGEFGFAAVLATGLAIQSSDRLTLEAPALPEGLYDVAIRNADTVGSLHGAYIAYDPTRVGIAVLGVVPAIAAAGETITVVGRGFDGAATVKIDGMPAMVGTRDDRSLSVMVPAGVAPGSRDVTVHAGGADLVAAGALTVLAPVSIASVSPASGPASGGTMVTIEGAGFSAGLEVRIGDVPLAEVAVSSTEITGRTIAGAHGAQDVTIRQAGRKTVLKGAFRFEEPFEILRIEPTEGSIAGNTYVTVFGRGFDAPATVKFGATSGGMPTLENGSVLGVRTKPAMTGTVDVVIDMAQSTTLPKAFQFYDPRIVTGGAWGGPIEGSVNVGVLDSNSGNGIPGMLVQLGFDADPHFAAITDANGLATISYADLRGPLTVTAASLSAEFVTFQEINARNLTMYSGVIPGPPPAELPPAQPCDERKTLVRGKVFRFKSSIDPVTRPGWQPAAIVTYSQPNIYRGNPPMPAAQRAVVTADGQAYEIEIERSGTIAVYAILGDFNQQTQEFIPRRMGIVRQVPAALGQTVEDINIALDIELDREVDVRLSDPPIQDPGPTGNVIFPYLNLESEGVISFSPTIVDRSSTVHLTGLPNLAGAKFFYFGGSATDYGGGQLGIPWSVTIAEAGDETDKGLDVGPLLKMPDGISPKYGEVVAGGAFSWSVPGLQPDLTTLWVPDVTADQYTSCCCTDANKNGQCEPTEELICLSGQLPITRWTVYARGGNQSYFMPALPPGLNAFPKVKYYDWYVQQAVAPRFDFNEFIQNQFSPFFWKSWTMTVSSFLAKEQTR